MKPTISQAMDFDTLRAVTPWPVEVEELVTEERLSASTVPPTLLNVPYPHTATIGGRPSLWRGSLRISTSQDPRSPDYTRFIPGGAVLTDHARVERFYAAARRHRDRIEGEAAKAEEIGPRKGFHDSMIYAGEWDVYKKLTILIGRRWDGYLGRLGPEEDHSLPPDIWRMADRLADWYLDQLDGLPLLPTTDPYDTNAGWPTFTAGPIPKLVGACLANDNHSLDEVLDISTRYASRFAIPQASVQSFGLAYRSGPLYKWQPDWNYAGAGEWTARRQIRGAWPRARHVFMGPFTNFRMLRPLWQTFMSVHKNTLGLAHKGTEDDDAIAAGYRRDLYYSEADFSGFDQSVTPQWRALVAHIIERVMGPRMSRLFEFWQSRPVLSPSWYASQNGVTIVASNSGVHSGSKDTSVYGTIINLVASLATLERLGVCRDAIQEVLIEHDTQLFILGDDTLLGTSVPVEPDAWTENMAEFGLKATTLPGCRFLMQHRTPDGPRQVASRVVQNSISPEYPEVGRYAVGMNAVAFLGRTEKGIPAIMEDMVRDCLASAEWLEPIVGRTSTLAQMRGIITHEMGFVMTEALESKSSENYITRLMRDAPYSASAYQQLQVVLARAPHLAAEPERFRKAFDGLATAILGMPLERRLQLATDITNQLQRLSELGEELDEWSSLGTIAEFVIGRERYAELIPDRSKEETSPHG